MIQQVSDLGWVEYDFGCATVCLILLGMMTLALETLEISRMGQTGGKDEWNIQIKVNQTQIQHVLCCVTLYICYQPTNYVIQ